MDSRSNNPQVDQTSDDEVVDAFYDFTRGSSAKAADDFDEDSMQSKHNILSLALPIANNP